MNDIITYAALVIKGPDFEREILSSFLEKDCLGIENNNLDTTIYFSDIDKKKVEQIIKLKSNNSRWEWLKVKHENWLNNWKPFFKDINIDNKVLVVPEWSDAIEKQDKIVIKIDPGMAFGTGHHESTELMIRSMLQFHRKKMDVLDIGTGSGILSILAHKLKSNKILSIDNDFGIEDNFKKNMLINNVFLDLEIKECCKINDFSYDMILANINKSVLIDLIPLMKGINSCIILSGILESDFNDLQVVINSSGFNILQKNRINEWISIVLR